MWRKYPNPRCSHVISVDVVDRTVDPITGVIRTERILGCKQKTPTWIVKVTLSDFDHILTRTYMFYFCKAIWRFWRRLCTRNFIRRPCKSKCHHNLCQPITITVCHLFRADSIFSRYSGSDILLANSGDTSSNGTVEVCCRWSRAVAGPKVRAECSAWKTCILGSPADALGRATSRPCIIRYWSLSLTPLLSYFNSTRHKTVLHGSTNLARDTVIIICTRTICYSCIGSETFWSWVTTSRRTTRENQILSPTFWTHCHCWSITTRLKWTNYCIIVYENCHLMVILVSVIPFDKHSSISARGFESYPLHQLASVKESCSFLSRL